MSDLIRVGGVPEHFNLPWHLAIENGHFKAEGLTLQFTEYPTGTGALCADLRAGQLDVIVALTEGLLLDIARQGELVLVAPYVQSPLRWGVYVAAESEIQTPQQLQGQDFAISRQGSGSHLMALLWAQAQDWPLHTLEMEAVGGLEQLENAVTQGGQRAFLWEVFTTLPRVQSGSLRCIDTIDTPWPCFMIACRRDWAETHGHHIDTLLKVLYHQTEACMQRAESTIAKVSERYHLSLEEARIWFSGVRWATRRELSAAVLHQTLQSLVDLQLLERQQMPALESVMLGAALNA